MDLGKSIKDAGELVGSLIAHKQTHITEITFFKHLFTKNTANVQETKQTLELLQM